MSHRTVEEGYLKMMFKWWKGSAQNPSTSLCSLMLQLGDIWALKVPFGPNGPENECSWKKGKMAKKRKCKTLWPLFCGWCSTASRLRRHYWEAVYFLPTRSQKFLVLIWSTLEGWKAESTLELPSGFEHGTP